MFTGGARLPSLAQINADVDAVPRDSTPCCAHTALFNLTLSSQLLLVHTGRYHGLKEYLMNNLKEHKRSTRDQNPSTSSQASTFHAGLLSSPRHLSSHSSSRLHRREKGLQRSFGGLAEEAIAILGR